MIIFSVCQYNLLHFSHLVSHLGEFNPLPPFVLEGILRSFYSQYNLKRQTVCMWPQEIYTFPSDWQDFMLRHSSKQNPTKYEAVRRRVTGSCACLTSSPAARSGFPRGRLLTGWMWQLLANTNKAHSVPRRCCKTTVLAAAAAAWENASRASMTCEWVAV